MKSRVKSPKRKSVRRKLHVKKSRSVRRKLPVKKSRSVRRKLPVKKSRSVLHKSPVKKSRSVRRKTNVKKSRSVRHKTNVKKSRSVRRKTNVKKSRSVRRKSPVKKSRSVRRKTHGKKSRSMLKGGVDGFYNTSINLVTHLVSKDSQLNPTIVIPNQVTDMYTGSVYTPSNVSPNIVVQSFEKENIESINDEAYDMYMSAKHGSYGKTEIVSLYDKIGSLYICSKPIEDLWNKLALELKLNIAIFNGESDAFQYKFLDESNYINGINILKSCSSDKMAKELNNKYNTNGKFFIGIRGTTHNYGSSFYMCKKRLEIEAKDFVDEYEKYPDTFPIVRIIKIFFNNFNSRDCSIFTIEKIKSKLESVKGKNKFGITNKDYYFNSDFQQNCTSDICTIDVEFEKYINDIMKEIEQEKKVKNERIAKIEEERRVRNRLVSVTPDGTDITKEYEKFFNKRAFKDDFDTLKYNESNDTIEVDTFYVDDNHAEYKIYLKKSDKNREYYFVERMNPEHDPDSEFGDGSFYMDSVGDHLRFDGEYYSDNDSDSEW